MPPGMMGPMPPGWGDDDTPEGLAVGAATELDSMNFPPGHIRGGRSPMNSNSASVFSSRSPMMSQQSGGRRVRKNPSNLSTSSAGSSVFLEERPETLPNTFFDVK